MRNFQSGLEFTYRDPTFMAIDLNRILYELSVDPDPKHREIALVVLTTIAENHQTFNQVLPDSLLVYYLLSGVEKADDFVVRKIIDAIAILPRNFKLFDTLMQLTDSGADDLTENENRWKEFNRVLDDGENTEALTELVAYLESGDTRFFRPHQRSN